MNRAQRRAAAKQIPAYKRGLTAEQRVERFYKNGITIDDLQKSHDDGFTQGWKEACGFCMRVCYAASVRSLHQLEGYGTKRNIRFLRMMDEFVTGSMSSDEAIEAAFEEAGVRINFLETFTEDRVQEAEHAVN